MDDKLHKRDGESELEYHKRLVYGKLLDKTLSDVDYVELSKEVFGKEYSSDVARRMMYGSRYTLELVDRFLESKLNSSDNDIITEIELKRLELQKERIKLSSLRNDLNKTVRETSRAELLFEEIKQAIPQVKPVEFKPLQTQDGDRNYLLCLSDIHYASCFTSENNIVSIQILHQRFEYLLGEIIKLISKEGINKLHIVNCGDSIQGLLRLSDLKKVQVGLLQSVIDFSRFIAEWLNKLSEVVEIEYHHVLTSNHAELRILNKERSDDNENLEYLISHYIHDLLKNNSRVNAIIGDKDYVELNLQGYEIFLAHGHQFKSTKNIVKDLCVRNKKFYTSVILGHFHGGYEKVVAESDDTDMELLVLPSIIGSDPYSDSLLVGSKSAAMVYTYERRKGRVQSNKFILN